MVAVIPNWHIALHADDGALIMEFVVSAGNYQAALTLAGNVRPVGPPKDIARIVVRKDSPLNHPTSITSSLITQAALPPDTFFTNGAQP